MKLETVSSRALSTVIAAARANGNLNLSGRGLIEIPSAAIDPSEDLQGSETKWWEVADPQKVDVSKNRLVSLPDQLFRLVTLTYLDVSSNQLSVIPDALAALEALRYLDVSKNSLQTLPDAVTQLSSLACLSCTHNELRTLPEQLGLNQTNLAVLVANNNQLNHLPAGLDHCPSLTKLILNDNDLHDLQGSVIRGLRGVTELDISGNHIGGRLTGALGNLGNLKVLRIRQNKVEELPGDVGACMGLVELHAGFNHLSSLPPETTALTNLKVLELRNNRLASLPPGLSNLPLNLLDLTDNNLTSLPAELGLTTTLRVMPITGNPLKFARRDLMTGPLSSLLEFLRSRLPPPEGAPAPDALPLPSRALGHDAARSGNVFHQEEGDHVVDLVRKLAIGSGGAGQELVLSRRGLKVIPDDVWHSGHAVVRLDLSGNKVGLLPRDALSSFSRLKSLILADMGLMSWPLPSAEGSLPALVELQVQMNPIRHIPEDAFKSCTQLRELQLAGVPGASRLPALCLADVPRLESLDMANVGCSEVPEGVFQLIALRVLNLTGNKVKIIPEQVLQLSQLEELYLANNDISSIPPKLGLMAPTLRILTLEGNVLKTIRRTILDKGTPAVLEYLKGRIPTAA